MHITLPGPLLEFTHFATLASAACHVLFARTVARRLLRITTNMRSLLSAPVRWGRLQLTTALILTLCATAGATPKRNGRWWHQAQVEVVLPGRVAPGRRLRGDYEPIDLLLLSHEPSWEATMRAIIDAVGEQVAVQVMVEDPDVEAAEFVRWSQDRCVEVSTFPYDTPWIRDYGPIQLFDHEEPIWLDFGYDPERWQDDALPWSLAAAYGVKMDIESAQLEGGAVVSNGQGVCAISDRSLSETGLPIDDPAVVERFAARLGCRAMAILPALPEEQTGHADVTVQFLAQEVVAVATMDPKKAPLEAELLDHAAALIVEAGSRIDQRFKVLRMPMSAQRDSYFTYLNGTRVGDLFLVPSYGAVRIDEQQAAYELLQSAMPDVHVIPIPADSMVDLGGAIHCITLGLNRPTRVTDEHALKKKKTCHRRVQPDARRRVRG